MTISIREPNIQWSVFIGQGLDLKCYEYVVFEVNIYKMCLLAHFVYVNFIDK